MARLIWASLKSNKAGDWMLIIASLDVEADAMNGKLSGLSPVMSRGDWVTRGKLRKGMFPILGGHELPILLTHT